MNRFLILLVGFSLSACAHHNEEYIGTTVAPPYDLVVYCPQHLTPANIFFYASKTYSAAQTSLDCSVHVTPYAETLKKPDQETAQIRERRYLRNNASKQVRTVEPLEIAQMGDLFSSCITSTVKTSLEAPDMPLVAYGRDLISDKAYDTCAPFLSPQVLNDHSEPKIRALARLLSHDAFHSLTRTHGAKYTLNPVARHDR